MKFRKKPVIVEAFQMTKENFWDNKDWPDWLNRAWNLSSLETGAVYRSGDYRLNINTLEGTMECNKEDWIIKGIKGELYPCRDDIFKECYELIGD